MYYTIYKITNQINGKVYIGSHKTDNLNDTYMGSGKYLKNSIEKNGIENFTKEILFVFDTPEEMYAKEAAIVNEDFIENENTYNLKIGGYGGWDFINNNLTKEERGGFHKTDKEIASNCGKLGGQSCYSQNLGRYSEKAKLLAKTRVLELYPNGTFFGKNHTQSSKDLIGQKNSLSQLGDRNSQFGTMWITNGIESRKISKSESIPEGWRKGRVMPIIKKINVLKENYEN